MELIEWLGSIKIKPKRVFLTHGEPTAADEFRKHIERHLAWTPEIPEHRDVVRIK
jgi:metallo-beta-lactamase family protein